MDEKQDQVIEFQKYLKKLKDYIEQRATFSFLDSKLYNKSQIDDIICCIESSWPSDYRNYHAKINANKEIKTPIYYNQLIKEVRKKFIFSSSSYIINNSKAINLINLLSRSIVQDMKFILKEQ